MKKNIPMLCSIILLNCSLSHCTYTRLRGDALQKAYSDYKAQKEILDYIKELGFNVINNHKKSLNGVEIDIFIPELNIGFEYNGLFWHSEKMGKDKNYHLNTI